MHTRVVIRGLRRPPHPFSAFSVQSASATSFAAHVRPPCKGLGRLGTSGHALTCAAQWRKEHLHGSRAWWPRPVPTTMSQDVKQKKADAAEHPEVFDHVGLLFNEPSGRNRIAPHLIIRRNYWSCLIKSIPCFTGSSTTFRL